MQVVDETGCCYVADLLIRLSGGYYCVQAYVTGAGAMALIQCFRGMICAINNLSLYACSVLL